MNPSCTPPQSPTFPSSHLFLVISHACGTGLDGAVHKLDPVSESGQMYFAGGTVYWQWEVRFQRMHTAWASKQARPHLPMEKLRVSFASSEPSQEKPTMTMFGSARNTFAASGRVKAMEDVRMTTATVEEESCKVATGENWPGPVSGRHSRSMAMIWSCEKASAGRGVKQETGFVTGV